MYTIGRTWIDLSITLKTWRITSICSVLVSIVSTPVELCSGYAESTIMIQLRWPSRGKTCASLVCHSAEGCCATAPRPLAINNDVARMALITLILSSCQTLSSLHADSNKGVKGDTAVAEEWDHIGSRNTMLRL